MILSEFLTLVSTQANEVCMNTKKNLLTANHITSALKVGLPSIPFSHSSPSLTIQSLPNLLVLLVGITTDIGIFTIHY
jgi:hypothetical protein